MRHALKLHPGSRCDAIAHVEAEAERLPDGALSLRYVLSGDMEAVRLPAPAKAARADGLWRRTCFEAFARLPASENYLEFNFSPSTEWAAYAFSSYRQGMAPAELASAPTIQTIADADRYELRVTLGAPGLPANLPWKLGLSAVIEDANGAMSYWALAHPPGKADFHHADCFALELHAPGQHEIRP